MQRLLMVLFWPVHLVEMSYAGCQRWVFSRPWDLLLHAAPAIVVALVVVGIVSYERSGADRAVLAMYQKQVDESLDDGDLPTAEIYLRKLNIIDEAGPATAFANARLAELKGEEASAERIMSGLTRDDDSGHPRAHFWVAMRMVQEKKTLTPDESLDLIHHLTRALDSDHDRQDAHVLLADIERKRGNREQAAKHLESVVLDRPEMRLPLAMIYSEMGDVFRSRQQRERAEDHFRQRAERDMADVRSRILWAKAVALSNDYDQATRILLDAIPATNGDVSDESQRKIRQLREALAELYVAWSDRVDRERNPDLKRRIELLQRALQFAPNNADALNRLAVLVGQAGEEGEQVRTALDRLLASGDVPAAVRLILGTSAATREEWDEAKEQLEQAYHEMPQMPVLLNNLAWVLASADPPEFEQAHRLADAAIRIWPDHPEILETRGVILAGLGRWSEALVDLESALKSFPERAGLHKRLAVVYEQLGDTEMADRHRKLAESGNSEIGDRKSEDGGRKMQNGDPDGDDEPSGTGEQD